MAAEVKKVTKREQASRELSFEEQVILQLQSINCKLGNIDQRVDEVCDTLDDIRNSVEEINEETDPDLDDDEYDCEDDDTDDITDEDIANIFEEQLCKEAEIFGMSVDEYKEKMKQIDALNNSDDSKDIVLNRMLVSIMASQF